MSTTKHIRLMATLIPLLLLSAAFSGAQNGRSAGPAPGGEVRQPASGSQSAWVAIGQEDKVAILSPDGEGVTAMLPAGLNPHILEISPDGGVVYVVNSGAHDRGPNAHQEGTGSGESPAAHGGGIDMNSEMDQAPHEGRLGMSGAATGEATGNSLWAYEAATGRVLARIPVGQGPTHPIPSPDGRRVYVTNTDGDSVSVVDTATWQVIATFTGLPEPHDGALTPDGQFLYLATSGTSTMTVVDTASSQVVKTVPVGKNPRGLVAAGPDAQITYVTNKADGTVSMINVPAGKVEATYRVGRGAHGVRISPDGKTLYIALSGQNSVAVLDAAAGKLRATMPVGKSPEQIDLSRDGRLLYAANNGDGTVTTIDTERLQPLATIPVGAGVYGVQAVPAPQ